MKPVGFTGVFKSCPEIIKFRFGFTNLAVTVIQISYLVVFQYKKDLPRLNISAGSFADVLFSLLTINIFVLLVSAVFSKLPRIKSIIDVITVVLYHQLFAYQVLSHNTLDFSVIFTNIDIAFTPEAFNVILSSTGTTANITITIIIVLIIAAEIKFGILSKQVQKDRLIVKSCMLLMIYGSFVFFNIPTRDNITFLFQSIVHAETYNEFAETIDKLGQYPYLKTSVDHGNTGIIHKGGKPNIVIIMVESFNSRFINKFSSNGIEITPYFNRLIKQGLYIENFYGNSVQTAKGQFSLIFSTIPSIKGKVFQHYQHNKFRSVAEILRDNGYHTVFYQAYKRIDSDNTEIFLKRNGFNEVISADPPDGPRSNMGKRLLWGIEDSEFFDRFIQYTARPDFPADKPSFTILATIISHRGFDKYPEERLEIYRNPANIEEKFINTIHITDRDLGDFFNRIKDNDYFKNTIFIITADHSYPLGQHGLSSNETGFYDESFRIPCLVIWKNKIRPSVISNTAFSQMDIAPSICDILGFHEELNHFLGVSFFSCPDKGHYIYLVQPYSGQYLEVVNYPFKYIIHNRSKKEYLFNLSTDQYENNNLADDPVYNNQMLNLREKSGNIFINQVLMEKDRIFPR